MSGYIGVVIKAVYKSMKKAKYEPLGMSLDSLIEPLAVMSSHILGDQAEALACKKGSFILLWFNKQTH